MQVFHMKFLLALATFAMVVLVSTATPLMSSKTTPENKCEGKQDFTTFPSSYSCSEFIYCLNNMAMPALCAPDTYYNPNMGHCDGKTSPTACKGGAEPKPANRCEGEQDFTTFPSSYSCGEFIYCLNNMAMPALCAPDTFYNPALGHCDGMTSPTACKNA